MAGLDKWTDLHVLQGRVPMLSPQTLDGLRPDDVSLLFEVIDALESEPAMHLWTALHCVLQAPRESSCSPSDSVAEPSES